MLGNIKNAFGFSGYRNLNSTQNIWLLYLLDDNLCQNTKNHCLSKNFFTKREIDGVNIPGRRCFCSSPQQGLDFFIVKSENDKLFLKPNKNSRLIIGVCYTNLSRSTICFHNKTNNSIEFINYLQNIVCGSIDNFQSIEFIDCCSFNNDNKLNSNTEPDFIKNFRDNLDTFCIYRNSVKEF